MRDFIVTLLVAFVLFRVLKSFNTPPRTNNRNQNQNNANDAGNITILNIDKSESKNANSDGEYVPYEEIKD